MEAYIKIQNLSKKIKNNIVLDNINLTLYKGKIYGFRGINGSGNTMLFRAICGLITPTDGEIIILIPIKIQIKYIKVEIFIFFFIL